MSNSVWERQVAERLGGIEAKLDSIVDRLELGHEVHTDHRERIGTLEKWRAYILGALAVISIGLLILFKLFKVL